MGDRLAVLHHPGSFFPPDLRDAIGDAADLIWVLPDWPAEHEWATRLLARLGEVVPIASGDLDAAASELGARAPDGIITFVDDHVVLAAELAERLGLRFHAPAVARNLVNKVSQRRILHAAGVPGPRFWALEPHLDGAALRRIAEEVTYPAVLKPAYGSGSRGIVDIADAGELIARHDPGIEQIVEEYLPDDPRRRAPFASYLSVESVVVAGAIEHLAVTGRFPLAAPFRETGNVIPAAVQTSLYPELWEITRRAIAALQITTGMTHTEIKLTPDGPRLIEVNGRLGGRPPFVLRQVSDVNLFAMACDVALGRPIGPAGLAACRGVGYWLMLQPPRRAGVVTRVDGIDAVARLDHVMTVTLDRHPGSPVDWTEGTAGHVVTVRGRTDDHAGLIAAIQEITATVVIEYEARPPAGELPAVSAA